MPRLLIVDDEWLIRKGIVGMVKRLQSDWSIEEAANAKEAIDLLTLHAFDLILCDIKMPGMDGIEMLDELTRQGIRIPVVYLTGYDEFTLVRNALRLRAYDYLLKPVNDSDVVAVFARFQTDFLTISVRSGVQDTRLQQFEFGLTNALESFDADRVSHAIEEGLALLNGSMSKSESVDEIVRVAANFFGKNRLPGFEKEISLSSNDLSNLETVKHAIRIRLAHLKAIGEAEDGNKIVKKVKAFIDQNIQHQLTLAEAAEQVHFNPTYFSEYFKEKSGETFMQYVTRVKIEKAKAMLADPTIKINDISDFLGYKDPRSFSKMFKMVLGLTPTEYRHLQR
ncbi:response regulator transcription factor [Paenibacillus humicola]|uniref:response regulator transcription factor n=1 Tax=Paenibacillus humicola TaxID=3110540 RepID=UPI00237C03AE|nr:response regulator [Paenibacillus humicola]